MLAVQIGFDFLAGPARSGGAAKAADQVAVTPGLSRERSSSVAAPWGHSVTVRAAADGDAWL